MPGRQLPHQFTDSHDLTLPSACAADSWDAGLARAGPQRRARRHPLVSPRATGPAPAATPPARAAAAAPSPVTLARRLPEPRLSPPRTLAQPPPHSADPVPPLPGLWRPGPRAGPAPAQRRATGLLLDPSAPQMFSPLSLCKYKLT